MPYSENMSGTQWDALANEVTNLINQLESKWTTLYDKVEQAYADADVGNSTDATFGTKFGRSANWTARLRSLASHSLEFKDFLDNGVVSSADRRNDADWFRS